MANDTKRAPANRAEVAVIAATTLGAMPEESTLIHRAIAILAALEAAGVRLVPMEATNAMFQASIEAFDDGDFDEGWRAATAASPYAPEGE